ncbi:anaphase-promoting complex subunit 10 isoform X2 [Passer montanus]|uniref:anaphase-promoting complex subunit 10 isoform X2 n=1 Tax=Passer montanus TaxID=9160 RepID=UPI001961FA93|nr:anaphase-promoting complex subunit 10 isoform X2 [Passer montanus]
MIVPTDCSRTGGATTPGLAGLYLPRAARHLHLKHWDYALGFPWGSISRSPRGNSGPMPGTERAPGSLPPAPPRPWRRVRGGPGARGAAGGAARAHCGPSAAAAAAVAAPGGIRWERWELRLCRRREGRRKRKVQAGQELGWLGRRVGLPGRVPPAVRAGLSRRPRGRRAEPGWASGGARAVKMTTPNKTPPGADPKQLERTGTVREIGSQAVWSLSSCKPEEKQQ